MGKRSGLVRLHFGDCGEKRLGGCRCNVNLRWVMCRDYGNPFLGDLFNMCFVILGGFNMIVSPGFGGGDAHARGDNYRAQAASLGWLLSY